MNSIKSKDLSFTDDNKIVGTIKLRSGEIVGFTISDKGCITSDGNEKTDKVVLPFLDKLVDEVYYSKE